MEAAIAIPAGRFADREKLTIPDDRVAVLAAGGVGMSMASRGASVAIAPGMSWRDRLRSLVCAGGVAASGCQLIDPGHPPSCGNANPDPCICGRDNTPAKHAECLDKTACENGSGVWSDPYLLYAAGEVDGGAPTCQMRDAGVPPDAFVPRD
jgi:hypothetical protein